MMKFIFLGLSFFTTFSAYTVAEIALPKESSTLHSLPNHSANFLEVIVSLLVVVALIFIAAWIMKRIGYSGNSHHQSMKVKACLSLSAKEKLMVVQIGDEDVVIGVAPGFVGHIKTLEHPLNTYASSTSESSKKSMAFSTHTFATSFNRFLSGHQSVVDNKK
jgi:flagellar protein FliO/FliZ